MVLIKEIELALKPKDTEVIAQEDDIIKDSVLELADPNFDRLDDFQTVTPGAIRKHVEADMRVAYPGKPTSRKRIFTDDKLKKEVDVCSDSSEDDKDAEVDDTDVETHESDQEASSDDLKEADMTDDEEQSTDEDEGSDFGGSILEGSEEDDDKVRNEDTEEVDIFSRRARDVEAEIAKGKAIKNQLCIWDKLIECRIKVQPALAEVNRLYQGDTMKDFKSSLNKDEEEVVQQSYEALSDLMKGLLQLQEVLLDNCSAYKQSKLKRKKNENGGDEETEIASKKNKKDLLGDIFDEFKPFQNETIQKWNEKTKISSGKISSSDFSAFDQPTLKQIEHILLDRDRLIKRTQTKRSDYKILGKIPKNEVQRTSIEDELHKDEMKDTRRKATQEIDPEIFDDDDFYHKLLRDFIERKADISDGSKRGKQWIEFQKLRSKIKAKVDTRASKGRKLRYVVHNKMVNFLAPIPCWNQWSDEAKDELFKSLFGQKPASLST